MISFAQNSFVFKQPQSHWPNRTVSKSIDVNLLTNQKLLREEAKKKVEKNKIACSGKD